MRAWHGRDLLEGHHFHSKVIRRLSVNMPTADLRAALLYLYRFIFHETYKNYPYVS